MVRSQRRLTLVEEEAICLTDFFCMIEQMDNQPIGVRIPLLPARTTASFLSARAGNTMRFENLYLVKLLLVVVIWSCI
jgi:hypothetical protein